MRAHAVTAFMFAFVVSVCGCAPTNETTSTAPETPAVKNVTIKISGVYWRIQEASGRNVASPEGTRAVFIQFDDATKRVTGFSGCNTFNGSYESTDKTLTLGPLISTRMACPGEGGQIEFAVLEALGKVSGYAIKDSTLSLTDADDSVVLTAVPGKP
jgi:heat shock protein HslJ